ncbi:hypothetical protein AB4Z22_21560 [Paenibacillus sp. TAF58]
MESYLLKPFNNHDLIQIIQNTIHQIDKGIYSEKARRQGMEELRISTLRRLLTNHISIKEYKEKKGFLSLPDESESYKIALGKFDFAESPPINEYSRHLKVYSIVNICEEIVQKYDQGTVFEDMNGDIVFLLTKGETDFNLYQQKDV